MSAFPNQFLASQKASIENLLALQNAAFSGFEKLVDLNLRVTKAALEESTQKTQEALSLQDPQQAVAFAASLSQPAAERSLAYGKQVYDIVSGVQVEISRLAETQIAGGQKQLAESIEQISRNAPVGSESAVAFVKNSLATATSAFDSMSRAAKQAAEAAESNIAAAANAGFDAASAGVAAVADAANTAAASASESSSTSADADASATTPASGTNASRARRNA